MAYEGLGVELKIDGGGRVRARYRCPWCGDNSNVAVKFTQEFGLDAVALIAICDNVACGKPSLIVARVAGHATLVIGLFPSEQVRYAPPGVPEELALDFQEALNCRASGFLYGAVVVARRVLQAALVSKGAKEHDLVDQINELSDDVLQKKLKVAAQHVRLIGNAAAHGRDVSAEDADAALTFVRQVFHDLFELPHQLAEADQKRTIQPKHLPK